MIEKKYNKTLELLIEQKQILIEQIKNNNNEFKIQNQLFENIFQIDTKIREYNNIIQNEGGQTNNQFSNECKIVNSKEEKTINDNLENIKKNIKINYNNDLKSKNVSEKKIIFKKGPFFITLDDITINIILKSMMEKLNYHI